MYVLASNAVECTSLSIEIDRVCTTDDGYHLRARNDAVYNIYNSSQRTFEEPALKKQKYRYYLVT